MVPVLFAFKCNFLKNEPHNRGVLSYFLVPLGIILTTNAIFREEHDKNLYPTIDEVWAGSVFDQLLEDNHGFV